MAERAPPTETEDPGVTEDTRKRLITFTERAREQFYNKVSALDEKLQTSWSKVSEHLKSYDSATLMDKDSVNKLYTTICLTYGEYRKVCREYVLFLETSRSLDGEQLLYDHLPKERMNSDQVNYTLTSLDSIRTQLVLETNTLRSYSSKTSNTSLKARAKAEAAKARLKYAEREAELQRKQAMYKEEETKIAAEAERKRLLLQVDLDLLKEEKSYAEAVAEADVWENNVTESLSEHKYSVTSEEKLPTHTEHPIEKARRFVEENYHENNSKQPETKMPTLFPVRENSTMTELSKFLVKKDLLFSRLITFSDAPEKYISWKSSFKNIVQDLQISEREEMDLMIKWLGTVSSRYALSIKASNINQPDFGLSKLWARLDERYGSPEMIEATLKSKLHRFPVISTKDYDKLYELSDLLAEIESTMDNHTYIDVLGYYNSSTGVKPIVQKLPYHLQNRWTQRASRYMKEHGVLYPPFTFFCQFIQEVSSMLNNPCFSYDKPKDNLFDKNTNKQNKKSPLTSCKTEVDNQRTENTEDLCIYHNVHGHTINTCRTFRNKPFNIRKRFFREKQLCFKCGLGSDHGAGTCTKLVKCAICGNNNHPTALHWDGGEQTTSQCNNETINTKCNTKCTNVCGDENSLGKSCAKVVLVTVQSKTNPEEKKTMYALIDDQSNKSLAKTEFFDTFKNEYSLVPYQLSSCAGVLQTVGRRSKPGSLTISSIDDTCSFDLPSLTECNEIPNNKEEIPTPKVVRHLSHLHDIADYIPEMVQSSEILLLIGRDLIEVHHVLEQRTGPRGSPYAQKLPLGWVVIGETCLGKVHQPTVNVKKTSIHSNGRVSLFPECENNFKLKDIPKEPIADIGAEVFRVTDKDERLGMSKEDKDFLEIMDREVTKNSKGHWSAPLPFRPNRPRLPNNRNMALNRTHTLIKSLKKNPTKQTHFLQFMQKMLDSGHAEVADPLTTDTESWYLPIFGIYHPKKKDQIRVVFDSSAKHVGISLNEVLMTGPDLNNSLLGILMRFRCEPVAASGDIQQMFYQFRVDKKDRDYLRFFWFRDNDPEFALIEYRMCVHVFGNSPSPAIATYGLRKSVKAVEDVYGSDVTDFVENSFYVDDGLISLQTVPETIDLVQRTQKALVAGGNLRLHKIASNSRQVVNAFPKEDLSKDLKDLDFGNEGLPIQRSLGLNWNLELDTFTFKIDNNTRPCTKRGILSTLNSLFDPLGFISPVVVNGRIIMRDALSKSIDWDQPLDTTTKERWTKWCDSLKHLEKLNVPRTYLDGSLSSSTLQEIHIFSDASEKAIACAAYLQTTDIYGEINVGFIFGKSKVAPKHGHTVPRLELCAAVLAVEVADLVSEHMRIPIPYMKFYTDSRVVLGYLHNRLRRFYVYVENRVSRILKLTKAEQWNYVYTNENPADLGTRPTPTEKFMNSVWLSGPRFLRTNNSGVIADKLFELQEPADDPEIRPESLNILKSDVSLAEPAINFRMFSSWKKLVNAIIVWKRLARNLYNKRHNPSCTDDVRSQNVEFQSFAKTFMFKLVQGEKYSHEIKAIKCRNRIQKQSQILSLAPFLDDEGVLRVGGRLKHSDLTIIEKNPILLPGSHWVATLVVRHYHEKVQHQGRQITEGAIREAGIWITGVKRLIRSKIQQCIKCKKLRGGMCFQKMADLPEDRLTPCAPFTSVGVDCFGPWQVTTRRTRGGQANNKRWAALFTCLTSRAVHIEVLEEMTSSSFINALRRFTSIRGKAKIYRSDRGTNFVGALDDLGVCVNKHVKKYLDQEGSTWILNPPHSSHRGGVWERMIGVTRRILDSMLQDLPGGGLTHEVLTTFMAEVSAIINSRPLVPLSTDPINPTPLSPSLLLTQKSDCVVDVVIPPDVKDMYRAQWKRVQILAEQFWKRWRTEFIQTLQVRRKWTSEQREMKCGDVILLRDKQVIRNMWPMGVVTKIVPSSDGHIRTVEVRVIGTNGKPTTYQRPVNEMVLLVPS